MRLAAPPRTPATATLAERIPTLAAASARILPSDGTPGAAEAGVGGYLAKALDEPFLRPLARIFDRGCRALDEHARDLAGCAFADASTAVQDDILFAIQHEPEVFTRLFFEWLVKLTLEGFLGDPVHGGNRDQLGWRCVGLERQEPRSGFCLRGGRGR